MQELDIYDLDEITMEFAGLMNGGKDANLLGELSSNGDRARYIHKMLMDPRGSTRELLVGSPKLIRRLERLAEIAPNFETPVGVLARAARLSMMTKKPLQAPPILLAGPPGAGKSFFAQACGEALGVPMAEHSMNLSDDIGALIGHSLSWKGARAGLIARTLVEGPSASPVIFIDEVDKASARESSDPLDAFHTLLEPNNARRFKDAFVEKPIRADHVIWLLAANDVTALRPSLVDRMLVIPVSPPTAEQQDIVIRSIYARIVADYGQAIAPKLDRAVMDVLAAATPRLVRRLLQLALGFAAADMRRGLTRDDVLRAAKLLDPGVKRPTFGFGPLH
jgi:ATP-dependent Lon protease